MRVFHQSRRSPGTWRVPPQVTRLLLIFALLTAAFLIVRPMLVPPTFGEFGHYRAAAVEEAAVQPVKYAGRDACTECHGDVVTAKARARHQTLGCETCHGPGAAHVENAVEAKPLVPRERTHCPWCHSYDGARPTGFPQIDPVAHNEGLPCIGCHSPHEADMPSVPESCAACHGQIMRVMGVSLHADVPCTRCHENTDTHKNTPHLTRPTKPQTRELCGICHAVDATGSEKVKRVDLLTHNNKYLCWQCHYMHDPEVR